MSDLIQEPKTKQQRFWFNHLKQCESKSQSLKAYADENDLRVEALYNYRTLFRGRVGSKRKSSKFVRANTVSVSQNLESAPCRILLSNGVVVDLTIESGDIASVLKAAAKLS